MQGGSQLLLGARATGVRVSGVAKPVLRELWGGNPGEELPEPPEPDANAALQGASCSHQGGLGWVARSCSSGNASKPHKLMGLYELSASLRRLGKAGENVTFHSSHANQTPKRRREVGGVGELVWSHLAAAVQASQMPPRC